jgi:hypothetical protein
MCQNVTDILNNAVMDPIEGYVNGSGGYCSINNTYKDLTAVRAIKCRGWDNYFLLDGDTSANNKDGSNNYIKGLLKEYTVNGEGCYLYLDDDPNDSTYYYVFLDCSNLTPGYKHYKGYIERKINAYLKNKFSALIQDTYFNAKAVNILLGGNDKDGKIAFLIKK